MQLIFLRLTLKTDTERIPSNTVCEANIPKMEIKSFPSGITNRQGFPLVSKTLGIPVEVIRHPRVKSTQSQRKRSCISAFAFAPCCFFWRPQKCVCALPPETWLHYTAQADLKSEIFFPPNAGMMSLCHCAQVNLQITMLGSHPRCHCQPPCPEVSPWHVLYKSTKKLLQIINDFSKVAR